MKDVLAQRDKQRREIRRKLNLLYLKILNEDNVERSLLDQQIKDLRRTLLCIDPVEQPDPSFGIPTHKQRSRLGNVI
ncbi:hypothetical protein E6C60_1988 [Paenibacillus algicola]|uniref:Uncharacterized protein n=1 Tax=Paenibacillus algicola TaxID=2565926 RepID=A0A4P8XK60_9BACL|nr:hypothetical protein [Paenibacillus algicola]QCT02703.1 hypothetical protein E6C60_1988 [Paenibacillus algicola]